MKKKYLIKPGSFIVLVVLCMFSYSSIAQGNLESPIVFEFFNSIYNYDFKKAANDLVEVKKQLRGEPEAWLCETNYYWWLMMCGEENEKNKAGFEKANLGVINGIGQIPPERLSPDEVFAVIHAYAYQTRYELHLKNHGKGIKNLRKIRPYLNIVMENPSLNEKYKFVGGLYHYSAAVTIEEKPLFRPLFKLVPKADKELGYKLLTQAAASPHPLIQTEASYFLMKINLEIAHENAKALAWSKKLMKAFPNNILYRYYVVFALAELGNNKSYECKRQEREIITLSQTLPGLNKAQRTHFISETKEVIRKLK